MEAWREDQLNTLHAIQSEDTLFERVASIARDLDFEYCAYGLRMPVPLTQPKIAMLSNYPPGWQRRYHEKKYMTIDPTVQHGLRSPLPVLWSETLFSPAGALWEDARSFGLTIGWAQASRDVHGTGGMLTMARSGESISRAELEAKELKMMWLTQVTHVGMARILSPKMLPQTCVQLSAREIEVLQWTGDGKISAEISDILNISERTVNFHISNAMAKLNASNKAAAVVQAAVLGMLY